MTAHRDNEHFYNIAQLQVLKLMITNPESDFSAVLDGYFIGKARIFLRHIKRLKGRGETINETSLLRECNSDDSTVEMVHIQNLFVQNVDITNLTGAIEAIQRGSTKYRVKVHVENLMEEVNTLDNVETDKVSDLLYKAQEELRNNGEKVVAKTFAQSLDDYEVELEVRRKGEYFLFHDEFLDKNLTKRASPGQVILIAGATGTGKSMYALNLINKMINASSPCMYFSLEMDTVSTFDRLLSMRNNVTVASWYDRINYQNWKSIIDAERKKVKNKPFEFIDNPSLSLEDITSLIRSFKMTHEASSLVVFIDLVTQVRDFISDTAKNTLATTIEKAVNQLNAIAKLENVCFVAVAQMNRDADSAKLTDVDEVNKLRPSLNNVKNSNALAERSRTVIGVFRPKYYLKRFFPNDPAIDLEDDELQAQILKQSQGSVGQVGCYQFNGETAEIAYSGLLGDS